MKKTGFLFLIAIMTVPLPVAGTALTLYAGGDYYRYDDRYDSLWSNGSDLFYNVGVGLDNVAGSGLSFHTDMLYGNEYYDAISRASARSPLELSTGYLDWQSGSGLLGFRLGRQPHTNLASESFDVDGLKAEIHPNSKSSINVVAGVTVPTPYVRLVRSQVAVYTDTIVWKDTLVSRMRFMNKFPDQGILMVDGAVSMIPFTTLTAAVALVPKAFDHAWITSDTSKIYDATLADSMDMVTYDTTYEKADFRTALGVNFAPLPQLRFNGSGRYSVANKGIDRIDGRVKFMPNDALEFGGYLCSDRGRIDSLDYFSLMFNKPLTEFGLMLNAFPDGGGALLGDYHVIAVSGEGSDHYVSFDAGNHYIDGGIVLSAGWHGTTLRPHAGVNIPFLKFFSLVGSGEYSRIDRAVSKRIYHFVVLTGGLKMAFHPIGLTIFPRVEYLNNRYYKNDLRLLVTTSLLLNHFWGNKQ